LQSLGERFVGAVDGETFGATSWVRAQLGINNVDRCSDNYQFGYDVGHLTTTTDIGIAAGAGGEAALSGYGTITRVAGGGAIGGTTQSVVGAGGSPSPSEVAEGAVGGAIGGTLGRGAGALTEKVIGRPLRSSTMETLVGEGTGLGGSAALGNFDNFGEAICS
jgi:hypothetical protein